MGQSPLDQARELLNRVELEVGSGTNEEARFALRELVGMVLVELCEDKYQLSQQGKDLISMALEGFALVFQGGKQ